MSSYNKDYYNKDKVIQQTRKRRVFLEDEVNKIKSNSLCKDCNQSFPFYCMDFDHLDSEIKFLPISKMIHECFSLKKILREIEKTELVCVMCHKNRTYSRNLGIFTDGCSHPNRIRNMEFMNKWKSIPCIECNVVIIFGRWNFTIYVMISLIMCLPWLMFNIF